MNSRGDLPEPKPNKIGRAEVLDQIYTEEPQIALLYNLDQLGSSS